MDLRRETLRGTEWEEVAEEALGLRFSQLSREAEEDSRGSASQPSETPPRSWAMELHSRLWMLELGESER